METLRNPKDEVHIGLVGKYIELQDAYKSIHESFIHAGVTNTCKVHIEAIHSEYIDEHNGQISVSSILNRGTTVTISLPLSTKIKTYAG